MFCKDKTVNFKKKNEQYQSVPKNIFELMKFTYPLEK